MDEGSIQPGEWRPQPKILLRVTHDLRERVRRCAALDGISMNRFCIAALESWCQATEELKESQEQAT